MENTVKYQSYNLIELNNTGIILFIIGCILLYVGHKLTKMQNKVEYRYLPRNVEALVKDSNMYTKDAFKVMKEDDTVWIQSPWLEAYSRQKMGIP